MTTPTYVTASQTARSAADPMRAPVVLPAWAEPFLEHYTKTGLMATSAQMARCTLRQVNSLRKRSVDFEDAFDEAHEIATDILEREARRRALEGVAKGVYYQGEQVAVEHVPSDTLMKEMLKAKRPEFRDKLEHTGVNGQPLTLTIRTFDEDGNEVVKEQDLAPQPTPIDVTPPPAPPASPDPTSPPDEDDPTEGLA